MVACKLLTVSAHLKPRVVPGSGLRKATLACRHVSHRLNSCKQASGHHLGSAAVAVFSIKCWLHVCWEFYGSSSLHVEVWFIVGC